MSISTVDRFDLDAFPKGVVSRRWLHLMEDGLGAPVQVPMMVARGARPGPVVGITAAVHGNELNGIPVIHDVFERLEPHKLRGTVVAIPVANAPAFHRHQRLMMEGWDLNQQFPGRPDGHFGSVYAHRFLERFARHLDLLLDLHTASQGRVNSLYVRADLEEPTARRMAYLQRPQIILHNPPNDATLRGACDDVGVPAITVEIGNPGRFQPKYIEKARVGIRAVLAEHGLVGRRRTSLGPAPVVCDSSRWMFTQHGGLLEMLTAITEHVEEGQPIARIVDPFGDVVHTYTAPHDGVIIGHAVNPVATTGARIVHLGRPAPAGSPLRDAP